MNVVILMGRLTADPELRRTANDIAVTSFRIAVDRPFVSKQGGERQTDFINIVAWRQQAEFICKYFRKGNMIALEGSLQTRSYEDKNGNKVTTYDVVVSGVHFTGSKAESGSGNVGGASAFEVPVTTFASGSAGDFEVLDDDSDDDLPF